MDGHRASSKSDPLKVNDENLFKNQSYSNHKNLQKQN